MDAKIQYESQNTTGLLVSEEQYTLAGVHIGTQQKTKGMMKFIYKKRTDGLYVINIKETDNRIRYAAKFISMYEPSSVLVVGVRQYAHKPAKLFADNIGATAVMGRFIPGRLTNPNLDVFTEPSLVILTDPSADHQALQESKKIHVPIIALCDTNNELNDVELAIPTNNKGRMSLALVYWLLTREVLLARGSIKSPNDFTIPFENYVASL
ncbi:MAG: 30S ribosomal protein S2 [Thermoplasmata archaeon]